MTTMLETEFLLSTTQSLLTRPNYSYAGMLVANVTYYVLVFTYCIRFRITQYFTLTRELEYAYSYIAI